MSAELKHSKQMPRRTKSWLSTVTTKSPKLLKANLSARKLLKKIKQKAKTKISQVKRKIKT